MNKKIFITCFSDKRILLLHLLFALLIVSGCCAGSLLGRNTDDFDLIAHLFDFSFSAGADINFFVILSAFLDNAVWAVLFLFCAFSAFGAFGIAAMVFFKSGLSSFSLCTFIRCFGTEGIMFSILFFCAELILILPFFIILAAKSFELSAQFAKLCLSRFASSETFNYSSLFITVLVYFVFSAAAALLKCFVLYPAAISVFPT